jgi:hypothetical protein
LAVFRSSNILANYNFPLIAALALRTRHAGESKDIAMDINLNNPLYIFCFVVFILILLSVREIICIKTRKTKQIKLLEGAGFRINDKVSSIQKFGLIKLAPEAMTPEKLSIGQVNIGPKDPDVWWYAKKSNNEVSLTLIKVYKYCKKNKGPKGIGRVEKIMAVFTLNKSSLDKAQLTELSRQLPRAESLGLTEQGAYFVYKDDFSYEKLIGLTDKIMRYQPR